MLISLRNDQKDHLRFLTSQSVQVVIDFCKLTIDFLQNGPNVKLYEGISDKLSTDLDTVQNCVYGLVSLLLHSCKRRLSEADFRDSILTIGFNSDHQNVLYKFYESKKSEINNILKKLSISEPHYDNLEWRFEVQVSSRALLQQITPLVVLDLCLKTTRSGATDPDKEHFFLQTDVTNLLYITQALENALTESNSRHSRKVQGTITNL